MLSTNSLNTLLKRSHEYARIGERSRDFADLAPSQTLKSGVKLSHTIQASATLWKAFCPLSLSWWPDQVYWPARVAGKLLLFRLQLWDAGDAAVRKYGHVYPVCRWQNPISHRWIGSLNSQGGGIWGAFGLFLQWSSFLGGIAWPDSEDCDAGKISWFPPGNWKEYDFFTDQWSLGSRSAAGNCGKQIWKSSGQWGEIIWEGKLVILELAFRWVRQK